MKKKQILSVLLVLAMSLSLTACGKDEDEKKGDEPQQAFTVETVPDDQVKEQEESQEEEPEDDGTHLYPVIGEREVKDGKMQSYLTGEWTSTEKAARRPIAVSIPNQKSCLPHYGISNASVIYQVPLRDNLTRLFCLFEDFDDLDHIGPVRSIRDYMVYIGLEHDAIICHWGSAYYANDLLNSEYVSNISQATSGITKPTGTAFKRLNRPGYNTTDSAYMVIDGLMKGVEERGYNWAYDNTFSPKFLFAQDGVKADYADAETATKIWPGTEGNYNTVKAYFEYDESTGLYTYEEYGGPLKDERNSESIQVSNVVLQVCPGEERDAHGYLILEMHGETGDRHPCYFFTNGKVVKGSWARVEGDDKPARYYDEQGNELVFNQGKTFICEIWNKWADSIKYE